jgi:glutamate-1-semialdehyde aminotransferase
MPFRKFFGRGNDDPAPAPPADEVEAPEEDAEYEDGIPEALPNEDEIDEDWRTRAAAVIPGGSSTGSKRPAALYGEATTTGPSHYLRATGCQIVTASERSLIDCTMALGAVSLGYGDDAVVRAVVQAVANGQVAGLAHVYEVEIAERLCDVIPCAERVRFLKTGAEGVSAAVRIARAATGRSTVVCCGYFGWHDWSNSGPGIPASASMQVQRMTFDDVPALEAAVAAAGTDLAAILLEPVIERMPSAEWIAAARAACDRAGAVLIFDEMKTGFRLATGGYQQLADVKPDVAVFGKAMACGLPIAAVVGSAAVMESAADTWISSTLAGESSSLAAIAAVLERYAEVDVCAALARVGGQMRASLGSVIAASGAPGVTVDGLDPMWLLRFEDPLFETHFLERAASLGVLFKRGAYNYPALAHDDDEILAEIERTASTAFVEVLEEGQG